MRKISLLGTGAALNFLLAIGHILCMPWLDAAFRMYGINKMMDEIALHGSCLPYVITVFIAACFALCALYALSAEGSIRKLPLLWWGIFTIASLFLFRAAIGCYWMLESGDYPITGLSSVIISGGIGLLYLVGGIEKLKK